MKTDIKKWWLPVSLGVFFLVMMNLMQSSTACLQSPNAPFGIVSLQLVESDYRADIIKKEWKGENTNYFVDQSNFNYEKHFSNNCCQNESDKECNTIKDEAVSQTKTDYMFILSYVLLLVWIGYTTYKFQWPNNIKRKIFYYLMLFLPIGAGLADVIENIFIVKFLNDEAGSISHLTFYIPAFIKFLLLAVFVLTTIFLWFFHPMVKALFQILKLYFAEVVVLLILYLGLGLSQGQDVMNEAIESSSRPVAAIFAAMFLSYILWYTSRLKTYSKRRSQGNEDISVDSSIIELLRKLTFNTNLSIKQKAKKVVNTKALFFYYKSTPRFFPWAVFLIFQLSILDNPAFDSEIQSWVVLLLNIPLLIFFNRPSDNTLKLYFLNKGKLLPLILILPVILLIILGVAAGLHKGYSLPYGLLIISFYISSIYLVLLTRIRRLVLNNKITSNKSVNLTGKLIQYPIEEKYFFYILNVLALISGTFLILLAWNPQSTVVITALPLLFIALAVLAGFFNLLSVVGIKQKVNLNVLFFIFLIICSNFDDNYKVRMPYKTAVNPYSQRLDFDTYVQSRFKLDTTDFPIFLVLSDGGATRSAYWVNSVLGYIVREDAESRFTNHLFSLAGASGGSVGNASFFSYLAEKGPDTGLLENCREFLEKDFLTHALAKMFSTDLIEYFLPGKWVRDRAEGVEIMLEHYEDSEDPEGFSKYISSYITQNKAGYTYNQLPILLMNTTRVQDGSPGIISTIKLGETFPGRIDFLSLLQDDSTKQYEMNLSTTAIMSSRFPYISPAANVRNHHFVDGGYFDNSGAGPTLQMLQRLDQMDSFRFDYYIVHIRNSPTVPQNQLSGINSFLNDLAAPILTLVGSYEKQTGVNNIDLESYLKRRYGREWKKHYISVELYDTTIIEDPYSYSWSMSDHTRKRMDQRLEGIKKQLDRQVIDVMNDFYKD